MAIHIPSDIQQRVDAQIATGAFDSEDDVLREAMDTLERRQRGLAKLQAMVREAEESVEAGRVGEFDREDIKRDVRQRLAQQGIC